MNGVSTDKYQSMREVEKMNHGDASDEEDDSDEEVVLSAEEKHKQRVAAFQTSKLLREMVKQGSIPVDRDSVYGSCLVLPQVARSCGWKRTFTTLAVRNYMNLFLNYLFQLTLLYMVTLESRVMNPLGGQMHLCSYANHLSSCQNEGCEFDKLTTDECQDFDAPNCQGPGGSRYNKNNLFANFDVWATRVFVRDSLVKLFPAQAEEINRVADPGEYGMESRICRGICMLLFVMAVIKELNSTINLIWMLNVVPSKGQSWVDLNMDKSVDADDRLTFSIAGMPRRWKVINIVIIAIPRFYIWTITVNAGIRFLMETAGIVDLILNSVAMGFILDIDELIMQCLSNDATKHVMETVQDYDLFDKAEILDEHPSGEELDAFETLEAWKLSDPWFWMQIFPRRLATISLVAIMFYLMYFKENCDQRDDTKSGDLPWWSFGSYVSKPLMLPVSSSLRSPFDILLAPLTLFLPGGLVGHEENPAWEMPKATW